MYVSHILTLEGGQGCKLVYTSYDGVSCAAGRVKSMPAKHMESSWDALEVSLKRELLEQYRSECARNRCPTHVFVLATGWNQSEQSSLESYQAWAKNISDDLEVRGGAVRPMFVGISWPANWVVPFISFVNKAHDADEAGFIWGSILVNRPLAQLHRELGLKTVLVGHSFGAKILTSAVAGKELIEPLGCDGESGLTVIGLQAAFSTGRFAMGRGFERNPYRDVRRCGTRLAYTVSTHDEGVRVAPMQIFARETGYVGGKKGFESALLDPDIFVRSKADSAAGLVLEPPGASPSGRILLIDSSTGIHCHNDVADPFVAHLISSVVLGEYSGREGVLDMDDVCKHR
ncbi:MAG: hypothetical protein CFE28_10690 [Alphaproteobacteria bacterium PA2]|nr:MAG: hypothetical protein CFE28_10690 [Alphaproteobacteria bacterium PA2]